MFSQPSTFYGATALYLSSHFLIHILSSCFLAPFLHSEWLCWAFLLLAAKFVRPSKDDDRDAATQPDRLALVIAAVCAFRTIGGVDWALVVPFTLLAYAPTDARSRCSHLCRYSSFTKPLTKILKPNHLRRLSLSAPSPTAHFSHHPRPLL